MLDKIILDEGINLVCYQDSLGKRKFVVEGPLCESVKYQFNGLDGPLELPSIQKNVLIEFETSQPIIVKGDFAGKLILTNENSSKFTLEIQGRILASGQVNTLGTESVTVRGAVEGNLFTRCLTVIEGDVSSTAKIHGDEIKIWGVIDPNSDIKSKKPLVYNTKLNPCLVSGEEINCSSHQGQKEGPHYFNPNKKRLGIISYHPSPFSKKDTFAAERKREKYDSDNIFRDEAIPLGRKNESRFTILRKEVFSHAVTSESLINKSVGSEFIKKRSEPHAVNLSLAKDQQNKKIKTALHASLMQEKPLMGRHVEFMEGEKAFKNSKQESDKVETEEISLEFKKFIQENFSHNVSENSILLDDGFDDLARELERELLEQQSDELAGLDDEELNQYIKNPKEVTTECAAAHFEQKRLDIIENVADFFESLDKGGKVPLSVKVPPLLLRKHQIAAVEALKNKLIQDDVTKGYVDCATGTGKTIIMLAYYLAMGKPPTLIIESRSNLISQTFDRFRKHLPDCDIGIFDGKHKTIGKDITITTYPSLQQQYQKSIHERELKPGKFLLVFCDEAHNALAKGRHESISEYFQSAFVFGCSATTKYNGHRELGSLRSMAELFGTLIYKYSLSEASEDHLLSPCENIKVEVHADIDINAIRRSTNSKNRSEEDDDDYNERELAKQLNQKKINQIPVLLYANGISQRTGERLIGKSAVVFAIGVDNARNIAKEFNELLGQHPYFVKSKETVAMAIDGSLSSEVKQSIFKQHKKGKIKVLICDKLCTEGYDNHRVEVIINSKPTKSQVEATQRGGRGTRLSKCNANKLAMIIDLFYPKLDQITFDQVLGNKNICGEKFIKRSDKALDKWELAEISDVESFTILGNSFELLQKMPAKVQRETTQITSVTKVGMFKSPEQVPVTAFNVMTKAIPELEQNPQRGKAPIY